MSGMWGLLRYQVPRHNTVQRRPPVQQGAETGLDTRRRALVNSRADQQTSLEHLTTARLSPETTLLARAEQDVATAHLPVADAVARRYWGRGIPLEDLEQIARLGLVMAVKRWNPDKGADFVGFAVPTISGSIKRYFRDHLRLVRIPRRLQQINAASRQAENDLWQKGTQPHPREIAAAIQVTPDEFAQAMIARPAAATLDLIEFPTERFEQRTDTQIDLQNALRALSHREREILSLYYLDDHTQQMIADRLHVSQMQVSRLLRDTHLKLRELMDCPTNDLSRSHTHRPQHLERALSARAS